MAPRDPTPEQLRREGRASWPIRRFDLADEPADDLSDTTTPAERLAMMWPLAVEGWLVAGRTVPDYRRQESPARLYRPGEPRPDDDLA